MNEKDPLKDFIDRNRNDFDKIEPSNLLWDSIEKELHPQPKMVRLGVVWLVAASLIIILGLPLTFILLRPDSTSAGNAIVLQDQESNQAWTEFEEAELYYASEISEKVDEIRQLEAGDELLEEIDFLKVEYENLKKEMQTGADPAKIIAAMIENYRLRLEILEEILLELKEGNNDENENNYEAA